MRESKEQPTRLALLFFKTKLLCRECGSVQLLTDAFNQIDGTLAQLACGHRRKL